MFSAPRSRSQQDIWPGFVDALAALLTVIIFLLMVFVVSQVYLNDELIGRDKALDTLNSEVEALARALKLEEGRRAELQQEMQALAATLRQREQALSAAQRTLEMERANALALQRQVIEADERTLSQAERLRETESATSEAQAKAAQLSQQVEALLSQIQKLNQLLAISEEREQQAQAEIHSLGERLNVALASKVEELARYRSEFFGRLREILGDRPDIQVVKDRFVLQSEVLFASGSAEIGDEGRRQLSDLTRTLLDLAQNIPGEIDWILQVEGHTDVVPIIAGRYPSNWELSVARALAVVRLLNEQGIPNHRLAAVGFGSFQPLDPRDNEIAYRRNRRIELKLTQK